MMLQKNHKKNIIPIGHKFLITHSKTYYFLVIDATFALDNLSRFRKSLSERLQKLIMTTDDSFSDEKLYYDINKEAAKIFALPSVKID